LPSPYKLANKPAISNIEELGCNRLKRKEKRKRSKQKKQKQKRLRRRSGRGGV
jgi:hypothetical protein